MWRFGASFLVLAGLMVSLGSTSLVGQMASGLVLAYSRAFRVGDVVRFGDNEGTLVAFGLLATKIRTPRNEEVNVPNSVFTAATTINFSRYNQAPGTFLPRVLQTALSDFYIEYELRAVPENPTERPGVLSLLHANVLDDFRAADVAILSPHHAHLHGALGKKEPSSWGLSEAKA